MIKKQNLWFLTLFSLILVLSVYYITMPNDLLVAKNAATTKKTTTKEETTVKESDNLTALRVSKEEEREEEKSDLKKTMTKEDATTEEKNNAYEQLKYLNEVEGTEEKLEKKIKEKYSLSSFVKIDNSEIKVKSLQKALEILNLFTVKPVLGVTEISEYFGIYKSTVHNILSTLKAMEYLELGMNRKYYSIAYKRYRNEILTQNMNVIMTVVIVLIAFLVIYNKFLGEKIRTKLGRKPKQAKKEGGLS